MSNTISWEYPTELFDKDGYPTPESLDYIKNWGVLMAFEDSGMLKSGQFFGEEKYDELIGFISELWWGDLLNYEDGLLELHTGGWSGNEEIIEELKRTDLWMRKFRCEQTGGHYFFKIDGDSDFDWHVVSYRVKDKN